MEPKALTSPSHPIHLVLGLTLWMVWLVVVYGGLSVACRHAQATGWVNGAIVLLTAATAALLLGAARHCWRGRQQPPTRRFIATVAAGLYAIAALATLAAGLPALGLPPCA